MNTNRSFSTTITVGLGSLVLVALIGCNEEPDVPGSDGPMERTGEKLDEAGERTGEAIENAAEKTGEKMEEAGEKMQN